MEDEEYEEQIGEVEEQEQHEKMEWGQRKDEA